jgi:hypothetical protein
VAAGDRGCEQGMRPVLCRRESRHGWLSRSTGQTSSHADERSNVAALFGWRAFGAFSWFVAQWLSASSRQCALYWWDWDENSSPR